MAKKKIPGLAVAVIQEGRVIKSAGYGMRDLQARLPVNAQTAFEIGSITKQFTATLIMMLVAEGKLHLDDPITHYFPAAPTNWSGITVRHLLTHTSGLPNYTTLEGFEVSRHFDCDQFIRELAAHPVRFEPGAKFSYCNSGYNLLGFLIEKVSGENYWEFLRRRIFSPLKMTTSYSRDAANGTNRAQGYEEHEGHLGPRDTNLTDVFAAGAIVSNVGDLSRWIIALEEGKVIAKPWLEQMRKPAKLNGGANYPYGFGWRLDDFKGVPNIGHSGSTSGFSASLQTFPASRKAVIILCNLEKEGVATELARKVAFLDSSP